MPHNSDLYFIYDTFFRLGKRHRLQTRATEHEMIEKYAKIIGPVFMIVVFFWLNLLLSLKFLPDDWGTSLKIVGIAMVVCGLAVLFIFGGGFHHTVAQPAGCLMMVIGIIAAIAAKYIIEHEVVTSYVFWNSFFLIITGLIIGNRGGGFSGS